MRGKHFIYAMLFIVAASIGAPNSVVAQATIDDSAALNGIKEAKGVFLLDFTSPKKTSIYLKSVKGTHQGLVKQGFEPDIIVVFIGQTVKYLSSDPGEELAKEFGPELKSIAETVKELHALGVRMEVCAAATSFFGVDNQTVFPVMDVVGNGFISVIGWQAQGYQLVPVF